MIIFFGNGKTGNRAIQYGTVTIQHVVTRAKWLMPYASKGAQCLEDNLMYETLRCCHCAGHEPARAPALLTCLLFISFPSHFILTRATPSLLPHINTPQEIMAYTAVLRVLWVSPSGVWPPHALRGCASCHITLFHFVATVQVSNRSCDPWACRF
jgi:hypothetical protein